MRLRVALAGDIHQAAQRSGPQKAGSLAGLGKAGGQPAPGMHRDAVLFPPPCGPQQGRNGILLQRGSSGKGIAGQAEHQLCSHLCSDHGAAGLLGHAGEDRLCPQLTAEENVALVLNAEQYKVKIQYKEQIRDDLIQLGLDDEALALPARKLSGGQKRRTALLRALWAESDTLLLDEPFTGMDPAVMKKAAAMLKARCGTKPTLLATHDQEAIRELGWKIIELG